MYLWQIYASTLDGMNKEPIEDLTPLFRTSGVYITYPETSALCISIQDNKLVTSLECTTTFTVENSNIYPLYKYHLKKWKPPLTSATYLDIDLGQSDVPLCHEFLEASDSQGLGLSGGQLNYFPDTGMVRYNLKKRDGQVLGNIETDMTLRTSDHSLHDFTVAVSNEPFDPSAEFNPHDFDLCMHFPGGTRHGRDFLLDCHQPLTGRYVAIYVTNNNEKEKIRISNLEVYANEPYVPEVKEIIVMENPVETGMANPIETGMANPIETVNQTVYVQSVILMKDNSSSNDTYVESITYFTNVYEDKGLGYGLGFGLGIGLLAISTAICWCKKKKTGVAPKIAEENGNEP